MEKVINTPFTAEDHYEALDAYLTDLLNKAGADVHRDEAMSALLVYNRRLRIALALPVYVPD